MKKIWNLFLKYYHRYREQFWYLVVGGLTTVVNWAVFFFLDRVCGLHYLFINWIAWAAAVIFAFFPNRSLVFQSREEGTIVKQFFSFCSSRVLTFLIEEALLWITVDFFHGSEKLMKIVVSVIVVILNYIFSKLFVFKKKKPTDTP